jgi:maltose O-acetyltransferase
MANGLSHSLPQPLDQAPPPAAIGPVRTFLVRGLSYATNQIINHLPASRLRHAWYRHVLGAQLGHRAVVEARCVVLFFGPGSLRRNQLLRIGHDTRIGVGCWLDARGAQLSIGNDVRIAPEVAILTTQHDRDDPDFCLLSRPVVIEDQVSIGMRSLILPGVRIGRAAVICAGSVVTKDVATRDVVAGVPARSIGRRVLRASF